MAFVVALGGGQLIGGALASFTSWRTGFGVLGVLGAALAAVALRTENHHSPRQQRTRCSVECHSPDTPVLQTSHCGGPGFRRDSPCAAIEPLPVQRSIRLATVGIRSLRNPLRNRLLQRRALRQSKGHNRRFREVDASRCAVHAACRPRPHALLVSPTRFHAVARGLPARIHRTDIWAIASLPRTRQHQQ